MARARPTSACGSSSSGDSPAACAWSAALPWPEHRPRQAGRPRPAVPRSLVRAWPWLVRCPGRSRPGRWPGRGPRPGVRARRGGACSRITWAFVPLTPNDDTPARRGRPVSGQAAARSASVTAPAAQSTCGTARRRAGCAGTTPCRIAMTILITPRDAGRRLGVADVRLERAQQQRPFPVLPVRREQGLRLDRVAQRRAGAVRLDHVDVGRSSGRRPPAPPDHPLLRRTVRRGQAVAGAVGVDRRAADHGQDRDGRCARASDRRSSSSRPMPSAQPVPSARADERLAPAVRRRARAGG